MITEDMKNKLPTGLQTFSTIRENSLIYVDKTRYIDKLVNTPRYRTIFLSRPRRFGKTLLLNTIAELFQGSQELFQSLYIHDKWNWSKIYPVLSLSLVNRNYRSLEELEHDLKMTLIDAMRPHRITLDKTSDSSSMFGDALHLLHEHYQSKVVVLIDEYDMPVLKNLGKKRYTEKVKKALTTFYLNLKKHEPILRFVMLTGVSRFSGLGLLSGINNVKDITLEPEFSAICGYTEQELSDNFGDYLKEVDTARLKKMYNGYNWLGDSVYNPYHLLTTFEHGNSYARTHQHQADVCYIYDLLNQIGDFSLNTDSRIFNDKQFSELELSNLSIESILFQNGFLTIDEDFKDEQQGINYYSLKYTNSEARAIFSEAVIKLWLPKEAKKTATDYRRELAKALSTNDFSRLCDLLKSFFLTMSGNLSAEQQSPSEWMTFYASIFYALCSTRYECSVEDKSARDKISISLRLPDKTIIFESRLIERDGRRSGIDEIIKRGYHLKQKDSKEVYLVGLDFSQQERNLVELEYTKVGSKERFVYPFDNV